MKTKNLFLAALVLMGTMPAVYALGFKSKSLGTRTPPPTGRTSSSSSGKTSGSSSSSSSSGEDWDFANPCTGREDNVGMWVEVKGEGGLMPIKTEPGDENCRSENYGSKEEQKAFNYRVLVGPKKNEKHMVSQIKFTFTPRRDGKVRLSFCNHTPRRSYPPDEEGNIRPYDNWDICFYYIADIRVESKAGVKIVNGNFAQRLKGWVGKDVKASNHPKLAEEMVKVKGDIQNGRAFHTYHSLSQVIQVKKDVPVTVSFWWGRDSRYAALH